MRDKHGSFIAASELPKGIKPPYQGETVCEGNYGDWRLVGRRVAGDPLIHCVAHHKLTGIAHAERLACKSSADLKVWADTLPAELPADWIKGNAA